eukprot:g8579.t1
MAFRGPLALLWLALSAAGPAACFVVMPTSTGIAAATPTPKVVPGSRQGAHWALFSRNDGSGSHGSRRFLGLWRKVEHEQGAPREEERVDANRGGSGAQEQDAGSAPVARRSFADGIRRARAMVAGVGLARGKETGSNEAVAPNASAPEEEKDMVDNTEEDTSAAERAAAAVRGLPPEVEQAIIASICRAKARERMRVLYQSKRGRDSATELKASATGADVAPPETSVRDQPKKILIIMSDTGGGHRASSQALSAALTNIYGDQVHTDIVDIWTEYGRFPFAEAVRTYKFLGKHPILWKFSYDMARFPPTRRWAELLANLTCHRSFRECLDRYEPDLVVSTHPLCHHVPLRVLKRLRADSGKDIPFVTVVTDLGSAHPTWFDPRGDLTYVPSDVLRERAHARGIPKHKLVQFGLPVRDAFWEESVDKEAVQRKLGLNPGVRTALVVGGGDGVGKLHDIATKVADRLASDHHPGQVVVVCGTNDKIKEALEAHPWPGEGSGVNVRVLGFVSNMDEWMSAADLLVTKAGPGTIAEACTRGLPVILSSFLPGQEAGNVPYVTDNKFGLYRKKPKDIAHEVSDLLADREKLEAMGKNAKSMGRPHATLDIARSIVSTMLPGTAEINPPSSPTTTSV